jgi:histidinol-phosphate aminotransferase
MTIRPRASLLNPQLQRPSALQSQPRDPSLIWLDKNENLDPELMALSHQVLATLPAGALATYPEAGALYRKLGAWAGVSSDSLLLTHGSDGAIRLVYEAFVEPGEGVIYTEPTFAMYPVYAQMFGAHAEPHKYGKGPDGPLLDLANLMARICQEKPKLVCLPNPDSPTGTVLSQDNLRLLLNCCESAGTVLLIDEAYHPFFTDTVVPWTAGSRNLIVARTFAKAWGVAGLRIGYTVAHPQTIALLHKMRPMYEVSTMATDFMARMLDHTGAMQASVQRTLTGKEYFARSMRELGFRVIDNEGNFLLVGFGESGPAINAALRGKVLYREGFDMPCMVGLSRFSMAPRPILEPVVRIIEQAMGGTA